MQYFMILLRTDNSTYRIAARNRKSACTDGKDKGKGDVGKMKE
jgi:hypothetical protein